MRRLTRSGTTTIAGLWLAFFPVFFLLPRNLLFQILNGLCVSTCIGIIIAFWPGIWNLLSRPFRDWEAGDVLMIGVFIVSLGIVGTFAGLWFFRATGNQGFSVSLVNAFSRWVVASGTLLLLLASGSEDGKIPPKAYRYAGIMVAAGCAIAITLVSAGIA